MCFSRFNLSLVEPLRDEYARSIELLGTPTLEEQGRPEEHLGEHLLAFYWHDRLKLDDPLMVRFFEVANDQVRGQALAFVGQSLRSGDQRPTDDVVERVKALWEWRVESSEKGQGAHSEEMTAFGWTFASGQLDAAWDLAHLEATLPLAGQMAVDHEVAERLASLATTHPHETLRCVGLMVDGARDDWLIPHWSVHIGAVLTAALNSADQGVSQAARELINRLGARGHFGFSSLLDA